MLFVDVQTVLHSSSGICNLNVQFSLKEQGILSIYGASGAGKTTILRFLAGLSNPISGVISFNQQVWFDSQNRVKLSTQDRNIGMVFQDPTLFSHLNVLENISFNSSKEDLKWCHYLINLLGLSEFKNRSVVNLSGGQKQRVSLARALSRKPRLLLLDEPLSALDHISRIQLQDCLLLIQKEIAITSVLVSHDIGEVFKLSEEVIYLDAGKITKKGTPSDVFLKHKNEGRVNLQAQILSIREEQVIFVLSVLVAQDVIEIVADKSDILGLNVGDFISISTKTFSPFIQKN